MTTLNILLAAPRAGWRKAKQHLTQAALVSAVALVSSPAMAALPVMPTPGSGIDGAQVADGDWLGAIGAYWKQGITILSMIFIAYFFLKVVMGGVTKWTQYTRGQADIADLKEYVITGSVLAIALVALATYAIATLG